MQYLQLLVIIHIKLYSIYINEFHSFIELYYCIQIQINKYCYQFISIIYLIINKYI